MTYNLCLRDLQRLSELVNIAAVVATQPTDFEVVQNDYRQKRIIVCYGKLDSRFIMHIHACGCSIFFIITFFFRLMLSLLHEPTFLCVCVQASEHPL